MCSRPSRSLNNTVTALMRFSSVRYLMRSSWILCGATRFLRCSLALRFSCSSSSYDRERKLRNSVDMNLLEKVWRHCLRCVMGQTTLQYAQKGYRGPAKPVNRKNESQGLRKFLRPTRERRPESESNVRFRSAGVK